MSVVVVVSNNILTRLQKRNVYRCNMCNTGSDPKRDIVLSPTQNKAHLREIYTPHPLGMFIKGHSLSMLAHVPQLDDALIIRANEVALDIAVPAHAAQFGPTCQNKAHQQVASLRSQHKHGCLFPCCSM